MPASRMVWWKPRLLITVATTVSPVSCRPRAAQRADGQDPVAVDDLAVGGDRQAAVGVAVVGQAEVGTGLADGGLQRPRWVEPMPSLMFQPSGSAPMTCTVAPARR